VTTAAPLPRNEALAPLVSALLDRARQDAQDILSDADRDAGAVVAEARAEADALLADARAKGVAEGAAVAAAARTRAEREARRIILETRSSTREDVRNAVREAVAELRHDPQYPRILETLRARAAHELGPEATVTVLEGGGIVAEAGSRRLEYSLTSLADDLMDRIERGEREPGPP
jgi:vacuolar-type H+-ATPase subunit E/Vma4